MTPNNMNRRLNALESRRTTIIEDFEKTAWQAAYGRIFDSLCDALPVIDNTYQVRMSEFAVRTEGTRISSIEQMLELNSRLDAGTLTAADYAVLASADDADLITANTTTMEIIQTMARLQSSV